MVQRGGFVYITSGAKGCFVYITSGAEGCFCGYY